MFIKKILKSIVKSVPVLRNQLFPFLDKQYKQARKRKRQWELDRFRRYCVYLSRAIAEPFFVKVGANDGISNDPCSDILISNANWRGLMIEPVQYCFNQLKSNFPDTQRFSFEKVAIGAPAGEVTFYHIDEKAKLNNPDLPKWIEGLGSFDRNHIMKHMKGALEPYIVESKVQVSPLPDVLSRNQIQNIHLLHVDTEGYDYQVLKTLDFSKQAPLAIFVEHSHVPKKQKAEMLNLFHKHGYAVRDCGRDYFAINKKANGRLQWKTFPRLFI